MPAWQKETPMVRAALSVFFVFFAAAAQTEDMTLVRRNLKNLIHAQTECFKMESFSQSIRKVDLETAAHAVLGRCIEQSNRFKVYSAVHDFRNPIQFEAYWVEEERKDLEIVKRMIAIVRTQ
jgi:hypothetical protein